jgi:hypothetical protein
MSNLRHRDSRRQGVYTKIQNPLSTPFAEKSKKKLTVSSVNTENVEHVPILPHPGTGHVV